MLSLLFAFFLTTSAQAYMVISDVDDTIKITNSGDALQGAWRGLFTKDVFPAMPELYRAWAKNGATLHFVTASPSLLENKIKELLAFYEVPYSSLILRRNIFESKLKYKVRSISQIMNRYPEEEVILVGDDVGQDPEVFQELQKLYPERVLSIYIRPVEAREIPLDQIPYITTFDIINEEHQERRLSYTTLLNTARLIVAGDADKLFPKFAWCPSDLQGTRLPTETSPFVSAYAVKTRIEMICRARLSEMQDDALLRLSLVQ
jgi:hypothetical protein